MFEEYLRVLSINMECLISQNLVYHVFGNLRDFEQLRELIFFVMIDIFEEIFSNSDSEFAGRCLLLRNVYFGVKKLETKIAELLVDEPQLLYVDSCHYIKYVQ